MLVVLVRGGVTWYGDKAGHNCTAVTVGFTKQPGYPSERLPNQKHTKIDNVSKHKEPALAPTD